MSTLRKIADEKDARACLTAVARSGESLRMWAKRHRVDGRSLHAWKRNLTRWETVASTKKAPRLVELVSASRAGQRYVVRVGDAAIEVGDDFDAGTLRQLVEVLRTC
ncbi:MAG: hypothetical protein KF782_33770 [Labilithrix sp.]|nr:hypothetical protein [Labilithrix sp.]MCW5777667.1 hypothetical protein [Phycisphaeraceae bacterium]